MKRREFILTLAAGAAWPCAARAQLADRVRRIGVLANFAANDPEMQQRIAVFREELHRLGWTAGRNLRTEFRFYGGDLDLLRSYAAELAHLQPDVIVATPAPAITALQQKVGSIPIVSVVSGDPVRGGFVQSLARPGGNITGFLMFEQTMSAKWLELLKEIAPGVSRVAVMQNPDNTAWRGDFPAIEAVAPSFAVEAISTPVRDAAEIERAIRAFAHISNGGLLVLPDTTLNVNRELIAALAAKYRLPAVYPYRFYVAAGGLMSYGVDVVDIYRRVASYVDRILRGVHPGELPVQPTKFELVINLKTAKMLQRREFMTSVIAAAAAWPRAARAQQSGKIYRLGLLSNGPAAGVNDARRQTLLSDLAARGFVDGQNLVVVQRAADARAERLEGLVAELKAANVDVIVTFGYPAALAAKTSTKDIPIVVTGAGDPVATGLVDGLARPGGNITGVTELGTELSAKRLEILRDALPALARVAMLWNAADLGMTLRYRSAEDAARVFGLKVQTLGVREPEDFEHAFAEMTRERPDAILMVSDALTMLNRRRVVEFANANRLATIFETDGPVRDGGLMSYGPKQSAIGERAAYFVARILRGARPADLPLELPTRFELLINLKTAQELGLTLPPTLVARADEVIE